MDTKRNLHSEVTNLTCQIEALEYMIAQTMAVAVRNDPDPEKTLFDMQSFFTSKGAVGQQTIDKRHPGYKSAVRVFTSVKESLPRTRRPG